MREKLTKIWFAAMVACAGVPAMAAEMPGSGTKNFVPGGDAPSYFTNENGTVSAAAADQTAADDGADQPIRSPRSASALIYSAKTTMTRRHGGLAVSHRAGPRAAANATAKTRSAHIGGAKGARAATAGTPARPVRTASRIAGPAKSRSAKAGGARPAKPSMRHAWAKSAAKRG
jgi:hypothetical protein